MRPIIAPGNLTLGATVYHSAFGFAQVTELGDGHVELSWIKDGPRLPRQVSWENVIRAYALCPADGFFHRSVRDPEGLKRVMKSRPADAVVWLLEDLSTPLSVRDIMDWSVNRGLLDTQSFVRWWSAAEPALRADTRLSWHGDSVSLGSSTAETRSVEDARLAESPDDISLDDDMGTATEEAEEAAAPTIEDPLPDAPTRLNELRLGSSSMLRVAHALAAHLADAHATSTWLQPAVDRILVGPGDQVRIEPPDAASEPATAPDAAQDVRAAAIALLEALLTRPLPDGVAPTAILPFVRLACPDLAASALGPLFLALRPAPQDVPDAATWRDQWHAAIEAMSIRAPSERPDALLVSGYDSHIGRVKLLQTQTNQDALLITGRDDERLYIVADGISVSDAGRGDIASRLAVRAIARTWDANLGEDLPASRVLRMALRLANRVICKQAERLAGGDLTGRTPMGTTVVAALARGNRITLAWLGDSRAYLIGDFGASLLTADHNVSGERIVAWSTGATPTWSPHARALVRYLGHFDAQAKPAFLEPQTLEFNLMHGERLLLCSDGITHYLHENEAETAARISSLVGKQSPDEACRALVAMANRMGGGDNATAIVIDAVELR